MKVTQAGSADPERCARGDLAAHAFNAYESGDPSRVTATSRRPIAVIASPGDSESALRPRWVRGRGTRRPGRCRHRWARRSFRLLSSTGTSRNRAGSSEGSKIGPLRYFSRSTSLAASSRTPGEFPRAGPSDPRVPGWTARPFVKRNGLLDELSMDDIRRRVLQRGQYLKRAFPVEDPAYLRRFSLGSVVHTRRTRARRTTRSRQSHESRTICEGSRWLAAAICRFARMSRWNCRIRATRQLQLSDG